MLKELNLDEVKQIQLKILDFVIEFCDANNINYWLDGGTLIGSIRHKGYIPWDDDIDLGMLREDYDKFSIKMIDLKHENYCFKSIESDKEFCFAYGKVFDKTTILYEPDINGVKMSINIDIFVYDKIPDDINTINKIFNKRKLYRKFDVYQKTKKFTEHGFLKNFILNILSNITKLLPNNFFIQKIAKQYKKYLSFESNKIAAYGSYERLTYDINLVKENVFGEFEGKIYKIPKYYDEYLKITYGDYMQLPKAEDRVTHHSFVAFKDVL